MKKKNTTHTCICLYLLETQYGRVWFLCLCVSRLLVVVVVVAVAVAAAAGLADITAAT